MEQRSMDLYRETDYEVVQVDPSTPTTHFARIATEKPEKGMIGDAVVTGLKTQLQYLP